MNKRMKSGVRKWPRGSESAGPAWERESESHRIGPPRWKVDNILKFFSPLRQTYELDGNAMVVKGIPISSGSENAETVVS